VVVAVVVAVKVAVGVDTEGEVVVMAAPAVEAIQVIAVG
jgi:hypothetical protein